MQQDSLAKGQQWVESQLARLADDVEVVLADSSWSQSTADKDRNVYTLRFRVDEDEIEEKFTQENLVVVHTDRKVRARMEHRLKAVFRACGHVLSDDEGDVIDEAERDDRGIEFRYSITSYGADYPIDGLVRRLSDGDIFIPEFQRKFVWRASQSSRFIESLLLGLPVPAIFLGKEEDTNRLLVIDGQQRLRTLWQFFQGKFEGGVEFTLTGVASRFEGLTYRTLHESDRRRLNDSILHAIVVRQDQPEEDQNTSIYLLFERLNTGGSLLHPQEIRTCVYHGPLNDLLSKFNQDVSWRAIYGPENQRMKDRELILRFFTLLFDLDRYSRPMEGALNQYMASNRKLQRHTQEELGKAFIPTIAQINKALGTVAFRPIRAINAAVFDAVMVALSKRLETVPNPDPELLKGTYLRLLDNEQFKNAYESSTSAEEKVRDRIRLAKQFFADLN